jgi:soluble lytic murein transglycosylase-like protein
MKMNFKQYENIILKKFIYGRMKLNIFLSILILSIFSNSFAYNSIYKLLQVDNANKKWCNFYYEKYKLFKYTDPITGKKFNKNKFVNLGSSIAIWESKNNPDLITYEPKVKGNAYGSYALLSSTAKDIGWKGKDSNELLNVDLNAEYAIKYLAQKIKIYKGNIIEALAAYNAGKCRIRHGQIKNQIYIDNVYPIYCMINQYYNKRSKRHV